MSGLEALAPAQAKRSTPWLEVIAFIAIVAAAAALRFFRLDSLPPGIDLDEARNGIEVLRVLGGEHPLFFTTFDPREPAFIYSLSVAVRALGHTALAMHLTGALWGLLGVILTYPVAREWFGRRVALLASAGMAGSLWDVAMSRWGERAVTLPPVLLLSLYFLWRGFRRRSTASFALAGMFASLCAYAYVAARILPFLILLLLLAQWRLARANLRGLLAGLAAAAITIAPLVVYFMRHPAAFFGRIEQINSVGRPLPGIPSETVWQTALRTLGMFFVSGDANWRDGLPYRPVFVWWLAIPFCLGVVWALRQVMVSAKDVRKRLGEAVPEDVSLLGLYPCLWLLLWQALLLVPAFLARPSPQYDRTIGSAPSTYILLALGLCAACSWLGARRRALGMAGWSVAGGLLALLSIDTARAYFGAWAHADGPPRVFEYGQVFDAAVLNRLHPPPAQTFLFLGYQSGTAIRYLAPQYGGSVSMEDFSQLVPLPPSGAATYVFAAPSLPEAAGQPSILQRYFPAAQVLNQANFPNGDQAARVYRLSEAQVAAFRGSRRVDMPIGGKVLLETASLGPELRLRPGQDVRLGLSWRILAPSRDNYAAFVHVVDASGKLITQDDRQGMATDGWLAGQQFLSLHVFRLPADAPPGRYRVLAGIDRRSAEVQPSRSLGEIGPQIEVLTLQTGR